MTEPIHIEPTTASDLARVLFPSNAHSKLALSVAEFFLEENTYKGDADVDVKTLRGFVNFLITKKGYN